MQIDALSVVGDVSESEQEILDRLQARIDSAIELYNGDGALVKVNNRLVKWWMRGWEEVGVANHENVEKSDIEIKVFLFVVC